MNCPPLSEGDFVEHREFGDVAEVVGQIGGLQGSQVEVIVELDVVGGVPVTKGALAGEREQKDDLLSFFP